MREYIERLRNLSLMCPAGMSLPMLLQACRYNFLNRVEVRIRAVKAHTLKEPIEQAEIAKKSTKKFEPSVPKNKWGVNTKGRNAAQSSQSKGMETIAIELSGIAQPKQKSNTNGNQEFKIPAKGVLLQRRTCGNNLSLAAQV